METLQALIISGMIIPFLLFFTKFFGIRSFKCLLLIIYHKLQKFVSVFIATYRILMASFKFFFSTFP